MKFGLLTVMLTISSQVLGKNDWTKACLNGTCSYDIEEGPTSMGGTVEIVHGS